MSAQDFESRFTVEPFSGCWLWQKGINANRYGWFKKKYAHRVAWELYRGEIPEGVYVLHSCDTPLCVNPSHLFLGTQKDNIRDCMAKGRYAHGVSLGEAAGGSKLTEDQVREIRSVSGTGPMLSKRFGVTKQTVYHIRNRKTWRHIGGE